MKKLLILVMTLILLSGCASRTEFGECIGVTKEDEKPDLVYKLSVRNVVLAAVFFQTLFTPIVVLVNETYCPVGRK
jgi:uncharacterized protein YcfL